MTAYYNRFDPAHNWDAIRFQSDRTIQSAEFNEMQSMAHHRLRGVADAIFKDGDVVKGAGIVVNQTTGETQCQAGVVYLGGAMRGVPPATITIAVVGLVAVGVYMHNTELTPLQDPTLRNPAEGTRGYMEDGATRAVVNMTWGHKDDGQTGDFFPIWQVEDGAIRPNTVPPQLNAITQALTLYDVQSAGGTYVVRGMDVTASADLPDGRQVYTVAEGAAHINGRAMDMPTSRRVVMNAKPNLLLIEDEPHLSTTAGVQHINFDRVPCVGNPVVRITIESTKDVVHGAFSGVADPLPDTAVLAVIQVKQGASIYNAGVDFVFTAGQIDWSLSGAEPLPGSTYQVKYQHLVAAGISNKTTTGFDVTGALVGTLVMVTYTQALRRYDRLCMDVDGNITWIEGVPAEWTPVVPNVPPNCLTLATVYQSWDTNRRVVQDAVRMVPMQTLVAHGTYIRQLWEDLAELRLAVDVSGRHSGIKKGLFADPFLNDSMRDAGVPQTAVVAGQALLLPMALTVHQLGPTIIERQAMAHGHRVLLSQTMRTGSMRVNPYDAFAVLPVDLVLSPAVDRWVNVATTWASPAVERIYSYHDSFHDEGVERLLRTGAETRVLSETSEAMPTLRAIDVAFSAAFGPGEGVASMTFDGMAITPTTMTGETPLLADGTGLLKGKFTVPAAVPAGTKDVTVVGTGGSRAMGLFTGGGTAVQRELQQITKYWIEKYDPLAQTLTLSTAEQCTGIDLWFTAKSGPVTVQLREADNGYPTQRILAERRLLPADIHTDGTHTRITWPPVMLDASREYCPVLLCDDAITAVAVAELSQWDTTNGRYVTAQPYQVGMLLSSSNASTWTAHQTTDLTFRLLGADYTEAERIIDLGTVAVVDATDFMVQALVRQPTAGATGVFLVTLVDTNTTYEVAAGQVLSMTAAYTGDVQVAARLRGNTSMSAVLEPGIQLVVGALQTEGTYVSTHITAGGNVNVRVVLEGLLPSGSALAVHVKPATGGAWTQVPYSRSSAATVGVLELSYQLDNFAAGEKMAMRLSLSGTPAARPVIRNLRAVAL